MTHNIKSNSRHFNAVHRGVKTFEIRKNDRNFQVGDKVNLLEWSVDHETTCLLYDYLLANTFCQCVEGRFTGRKITARITYVSEWKQEPGYVVFSIKLTKKRKK